MSRFGRCLPAFALGAALLFVPGAAGAQEAPDEEPTSMGGANSAFAVSPGTRSSRPDRNAITLEVFPGQTIQDSISIFNFTAEPISFRVWSGDGYNTADGAFAIYGEEISPTDTGSWIELPDTDVTVGPTSRADLPILIRVPENAQPGDHAGGVAALNTTPVEQLDADGASVDILRAVGTRIYIRVAGPLNPALEVRNVHVDATQPLLPGLTGLGGAVVRYDVVNSGNLRLAPTAEVSLSGPFGLMEQTLDPIELRDLLPGSSVTLSQTFDRVPPLGRMTASIGLSAGDAETVRTTTFWAIPWLYLLTIAALGGGWWWYRRRDRAPDDSDEADPEADDEFVSDDRELVAP